MKKFDSVEIAIRKGYSVMPAAEDDNTPNVVKWTELQNRAMTIDELAPYWEKNPNYNIAIVTGKLSGITVIDVDGEKGLVSLNEADFKLPNTYTVKTPRGCHYYYKYNGELKTDTGILPGIDIRNDGGAVIAPGSTREGQEYCVLNDMPVVEWEDVPSIFIKSRRDISVTPRHSSVSDLPTQVIEGTRNDTLYGYALSLRKKYGHEYQECLEITLSINQTRCLPPLDEPEVAKIVGSVFSDEVKSLDLLPIISGREIRAEKVEWLLPDRVAKGKLTVLTGFAGVGKSFACMSIMAALSNGGELPDFSIAPKMKSLILLGEDGAADTLKPRMMMLGADEDNYFAFSIGVGLGASLSMDLGDEAFIPRLSQFIQQKGIGLLVIDPILSFTPHLDPRGEVQVRKVLGNLTVLAESTGCSIIAVSHKNKDIKQNNDLHRISGSQAFGAVARTVLEIIHDEHNDDKMILRVLKNNLAKKPAPLGFQVVEDENGEAVIEWQGELDEELSVTRLRKRNTPKIDRAIKFLESTLSNGPVSSSTIKSLAEQEGIKDGTLRKARETLDVEFIHEGNREGLQGSAGTRWTLPVALIN